MDYNIKIKNLLKEAMIGVQYKNINGICRFFIMLGMFPIYLFALVCVACYYLLFFIYKGFDAPIKYLHNVLHAEKDSIKHATQAIVYLIAFPFIFLCYCLISVFSILFYFNWFFVMLFIYISTLGGVRWQPLVMEAKFDKEYEYKTKTNKIENWIFAGLLFIGDTLLAIALIFGQYEMYNLGLYPNTSTYDPTLLFTSLGILAVIWFIVNPILFRKKTIEKKVNIITEEKANQ